MSTNTICVANRYGSRLRRGGVGADVTDVVTEAMEEPNFLREMLVAVARGVATPLNFTLHCSRKTSIILFLEGVQVEARQGPSLRGLWFGIFVSIALGDAD